MNNESLVETREKPSAVVVDAASSDEQIKSYQMFQTYDWNEKLRHLYNYFCVAREDDEVWEDILWTNPFHTEVKLCVEEVTQRHGLEGQSFMGSFTVSVN